MTLTNHPPIADIAARIGCQRWGTTRDGAVSWIVPLRFDGSPGRRIAHTHPGRRPYTADDLLDWLRHGGSTPQIGRNVRPSDPGYWVTVTVAAGGSPTPLTFNAPSLLAACELAIAAVSEGQHSMTANHPTAMSRIRRDADL